MKVYWYATTSYVLSFSPLLSLLNVCQKKRKRERDRFPPIFVEPRQKCQNEQEWSKWGETWRRIVVESIFVHGANKITRTEHVCNSQVIRNQRRAASSNRAPLSDRIISSLDVKHIPPFIHCVRIMQSKLHAWKYVCLYTAGLCVAYCNGCLHLRLESFR